MLSQGKWHELVPRDPLKNLHYRRKLVHLCKTSADYRRSVIHGCKSDLLFYINTFVLQYNPLLKSGVSGRVGPFITWPFQERALLDRPGGILWCYEKDKTAVVEKSRDMGASWLFLILEDWLCLFHDDIQVLNISRSADAVDSASKNSLFAKIRFMHEYLPEWLSGPLKPSSMNFSFRRTNSEITGEASTGRSGAGGRASLVLVDEFSEIKEDVKVRQNTASIAECRIFNGTHLDVGTEFYQLTKTPEIVKIQMHWTRHPRKNKHLYSWDPDKNRAKYWRYDEKTDQIEELSGPPADFPEDYPFDRTGKPDGGPHPTIRSPWYDKKVVEIGDDRRAAMELDINATGAASQFYNGLIIRRLMGQCREPLWQGDLEYTSDGKPIRLIPHPEGALKLWIEPTLNSEGNLCRTPHSDYALGGDLSWGKGVTPSCFTVFDSRLGLKVGQYTNYWKDPKEMAAIAVALAKIFKDKDEEPAYLAWECPGPGLVFGEYVVKTLDFRRIYRRTSIYRDTEKESDEWGWTANGFTKVQLHEAYRSALASGLFVNYDKGSLEECLSYVHTQGTVKHPKEKKNNDPSAEGTNHGDHVVADGLAWLMSKKRTPMEEKPVEPEPSVRSIAGRRLLAQRREREVDIWV